MVRVKAPLFSLDASGTVGSAVVFSKWKGRNYARRHAKPSNPRSATQVAVRAAFRFLTTEWAGLLTANKSTWTALAAASNISAFDAYVAYNQARFRNGLSFANVYPYAGTGATASAPVTTATGGVRQVSLSIADGATPPDWGWLIHKGATGFTPSWANVVHAVHRAATPTVWVDTPLAAGTYYYRVQGIMKDGVFGTLEAEKSGTAT